MDNMKSSLRKHLIEKLQSAPKDCEEDLQNPQFYQKHRLNGYLIADYLRSNNISYTYSVFLPEMRINSA